ncbi:hypothetical protein GCM10025872_17800 [Barrientosiimonas endolithica]|uniref:Glucose-1-phosphate adenylyltransferase/Bifunctional protein GlmU-like C-terminal hexapeptide domain-containing protein n=1 Tax=Barrientosiimonas endolithica TaxID=1535208 RepID=A0ABN6YLA2_9MICO|nr:hypothetical protein GCM10025872_17800 [Barrientosiimonas endolithica]
MSDSVLSPNVRTHSFSAVTGSVLLDNVEVGRSAQVNRAIVDKDVVIPEGVSIGVDPELDRRRGFTVTESGITVIGKGTVIER